MDGLVYRALFFGLPVLLEAAAAFVVAVVASRLFAWAIRAIKRKPAS